jgi:uncharacterized DUF497 family protein
MLIVWDEPKRLANIDKHRLDFADLTIDFFAGAVVAAVARGRFQAIGRFGNGAISVVFARLGSEAITVISMRPASRKERMLLI